MIILVSILVSKLVSSQLKDLYERDESGNDRVASRAVDTDINM